MEKPLVSIGSMIYPRILGAWEERSHISFCLSVACDTTMTHCNTQGGFSADGSWVSCQLQMLS